MSARFEAGRGSERGMSLLYLLLILAVTMTIAGQLLPRLRLVIVERQHAKADAVAVQVAQGGVAAARAALAEDSAYAGGDVSVGRHAARVRIEARAEDPALRTVYVECVVPLPGGAPGGYTRRVVAVVRLRDGRLPALVGWSEP